MFSLIFKLFNSFGNVPWLERYLKVGMNPKLITNLEKIAGKLTGLSSIDEAITRIKSDKELELEFQRALLVAENEYWRACLRDRQNARERDMALQKLQGKNKRANIMLLMAVLGIIISLGSLVLFKAFLTSDVIGIISAVAAVFGSCLKDAYSFEFGSSSKKRIDDSFTEKEIEMRIREVEALLAFMS